MAPIFFEKKVTINHNYIEIVTDSQGMSNVPKTTANQQIMNTTNSNASILSPSPTITSSAPCQVASGL